MKLGTFLAQQDGAEFRQAVPARSGGALQCRPLPAPSYFVAGQIETTRCGRSIIWPGADHGHLQRLCTPITDDPPHAERLLGLLGCQQDRCANAQPRPGQCLTLVAFGQDDQRPTAQAAIRIANDQTDQCLTASFGICSGRAANPFHCLFRFGLRLQFQQANHPLEVIFAATRGPGAVRDADVPIRQIGAVQAGHQTIGPVVRDFDHRAAAAELNRTDLPFFDSTHLNQ